MAVLEDITPPGYAASGRRRAPDFIGIGAQKAGTTWLHENLGRHPAIWLPPVKELQYFNDLYIPAHRRWTGAYRRDHGVRALKQYLARTAPDQWDLRLIARTADIALSDLSDDWYEAIFAVAAPDQICGEISSAYALLPPAAIRHILRLSPHGKFIYSLRDPIDRNWSHIRQISRAEANPDLLKIASHREMLEHPSYAATIVRWSSLASAANILVIFMDDIGERPKQVMREVCGFLGVEYDDSHFPQLDKAVHVGAEKAIPDELYVMMKEQLRPCYEEIAKLYPDVGRRWIARHYG